MGPDLSGFCQVFGAIWSFWEPVGPRGADFLRVPLRIRAGGGFPWILIDSGAPQARPIFFRFSTAAIEMT